MLSSCITTYKKTPPPVPPRTTPSKPFISITAQSSTESAQDAYMDGGSGLRTGISSQPGLSNSTESIDSMKALTAAIEAANAQVHGPASQHVTNSTITITATATTSAVAHVSTDSKAQREALRKCLSIGIQVDPEEEGPSEEQSKFQSIGIQVEDERCSCPQFRGRLASEPPQPAGPHSDSWARGCGAGDWEGGGEDLERLCCQLQPLTLHHGPRPEKKQLSVHDRFMSSHRSRRTEASARTRRRSRLLCLFFIHHCQNNELMFGTCQTLPQQLSHCLWAKCNMAHQAGGKVPSYRRMTRSNSVTTAVQADLDDPDDPPELPPRHCATMPRQHSRDNASSTVSIQGSGNHYHACAGDDYGDVGFDPSILPPPDPWMDSVAEPETDNLEAMEQDEVENELSDEILGKIRSAVGSAQLLMSHKFQQFRELCEENLNPNAHPRPVSQDLAGFWDMLQLSIENISLKFDELHQLKANNWKPLSPPEIQERRMPPPVPKKPQKGHPPLARDRSLESNERQRLEARKRLLAAKRAASVRQSSATESADSIEIYIPEAQTRL
ncbi:unnamed protein product [Pleuronectes platessa]|uniref:Discs, large (Drosophila) homolog-associated protein 1b n=1 Tax=Pleuronectes platessa TaxID=8262 RepID=A0A9N7TVV8_PLEPL|nr:unnamed protein product [Pleuronectes platessa]